VRKLEKKRCLITGGGKGIGRAIARAFAEEGADVAIVDRNRNAIEAVVADVAALGVKAFGVEADVSDVASTQDAVDRAKSALSGIDVLVNNAGIMSYSLLETMPIEMWDEMMAVNLRSVFLCSRLVIPGMKANRWGRIINLGSQLAQKGAPQLVHYGASKAAVIGFTRSLARELIEFGITVNAICPGRSTPSSREQIHPNGRLSSSGRFRSAATEKFTKSHRRRCFSPPTVAPSTWAPRCTRTEAISWLDARVRHRECSQDRR
jgi:3-oxoacyl-[acyl-carrier protein] reductase